MTHRRAGAHAAAKHPGRLSQRRTACSSASSAKTTARSWARARSSFPSAKPARGGGICARRSVLGSGLHARGVERLVRYAFEDLDLIGSRPTSTRATKGPQRTAPRLGFVKEGYLRERWIVADVVSDSAVFGLLSREAGGRDPARHPATAAAIAAIYNPYVVDTIDDVRGNAGRRSGDAQPHRGHRRLPPWFVGQDGGRDRGVRVCVGPWRARPPIGARSRPPFTWRPAAIRRGIGRSSTTRLLASSRGAAFTVRWAGSRCRTRRSVALHERMGSRRSPTSARWDGSSGAGSTLGTGNACCDRVILTAVAWPIFSYASSPSPSA